MTGRVLEVVTLTCLLGLGATLHFKDATTVTTASSPPQSHHISGFPPAPSAFEPRAKPPEVLRREAPRLAGSPDLAIERLAQWASIDSDPLRRGFANSSDLYAFLLDHLDAAQDGDGAAAYYIYLALDECRPYLRLQPEEARALLDRMQPSLDESAQEERQSWVRDNQRCHRFAGGDLSMVARLLGADRPGAESEYGSVMFERAADAGFAPAVAERALREPDLAPAVRNAMLRDALHDGNADVLWQLFRRSWSADSGEQQARSLAWLVEACRNGYDCSGQAPWYRAGECADGSERCLPGQSALAHYWYAASDETREAAFGLAQEMDSALARERIDELPLPPQPEPSMNEASQAAEDAAQAPFL